MSDRPPIQGERAVSEVASTRKPWLSRRQTIGIGVISTAAVIGIIFWRIPIDKPEEEATRGATRIGAVVPYDPPRPLPMPVPQPPVIPAVMRPEPLQLPQPQSLPQMIQQQTSPIKPARESMLSYQVAPLSESATAQQKKSAEAAEGKERTDVTRVVYKPATVTGAKTGTMPDRNLVLMPGIIRCTMATAINSDLAGPFICTLPGDVLSPSGVVLMEKGTQVIGSYASGLSQGQKRLMTVSGTAYTPNGVVVPLGGPMGDGLGRTGLEGELDRHLWERFGGALMLTLFDSAVGLAQTSLQKGGGNNTYLSFNGGGVGSLAQEVLRSSINIPPTISINQGQDAAIWLTSPIDFSESYRLEVAR